MSPRIYRNRLLKLADLLSSLPRRRFDFTNWGNGRSRVREGTDLLKNPNVCGTSACALGWAPALPFAKKAGFSLRAIASTDMDDDGRTTYVIKGDFFKHGETAVSEDVARELFGLDSDEFSRLFYPGMAGKNGPHDKATPKRVARHIREFVANKYDSVTA